MPRGLETCSNCGLLFSVLHQGRCERCAVACHALARAKTCKACEKDLPESEFYRTSRGTLMARCRACFLAADYEAKARKAEQKALRDRIASARNAIRAELLPVEDIEPEPEEPIDPDELEQVVQVVKSKNRAERLAVAMAVASTKNTGRGKPRSRHLGATELPCTSCLETLPADRFAIDVRRGYIHPHCHECIKARHRNRRSRDEFIYTLGRLVLWRMAYDSGFPKNFLETR
jgi:hypothetical protein